MWVGVQGLWAKGAIKLRIRRQAVLSSRVARDGRISENVDPGALNSAPVSIAGFKVSVLFEKGLGQQ